MKRHPERVPFCIDEAGAYFRDIAEMANPKIPATQWSASKGKPSAVTVIRWFE